MLIRNDGAKSWRAVELALSKTYFLATIQCSLPDGEFAEREIVYSFLRDVIAEFKVRTEKFRLKRLDLMSPGYINGLGRVALDPIEEIWGAQDNSAVTYVLEDGRRLKEILCDDDVDDSELTLLLRISPKQE